jgi:hypothetical protein
MVPTIALVMPWPLPRSAVSASSASVIFTPDTSSASIASLRRTPAGGLTALGAVARSGMLDAISPQGRSRKSVASGCGPLISPAINAANRVVTVATCQPICAADHPPSASIAAASSLARRSRATSRPFASANASRR